MDCHKFQTDAVGGLLRAPCSSVKNLHHYRGHYRILPSLTVIQYKAKLDFYGSEIGKAPLPILSP